MVSHFCICWWTGFPLSKAINVFLPVTLARVCQLLIYDRMSLMITPFDSRAHAFSLGSLGCQPIGWARGRRVLGSSQLWPERFRTRLSYLGRPTFRFPD